jgi:cell division septum initiation protein DivIVA
MRELLDRIQTEKQFILDERSQLKSKNASLVEELAKEKQAKKTLKDSISMTDEEKLDIVKRCKHLELRL